MTVDGVDIDHVRITRLLLEFGNLCFQVAGFNLGLANLWIGHQFIIFFSNVDVAKWYAIFQFNRIRTEEVHICILTGQFVELIRNSDTEREGFNPNFLIRIFFLGRKEGDDVWVEDIQIHYTRPLTLTELVGVGEAVLKELHNGNDTRGGSLVALDWSASLPQVAEGDTHTTTDTR